MRFIIYSLTLVCSFLWVHVNGQIFTEVALQSGIDFSFSSMNLMGGGLTWFDFDNDGREDLYITGGNNKDRLYRNNGDGSFTEVPGFFETDIPNTMGVVAGDIDNDGYRDLFVTTWNAGLSPIWQPNLLYRNNGDGTFSEIAETAGLNEAKFALAACFLDANLDGYLDIYVGNYIQTSVIIYDDEGDPIGFDHICLLDDLYLNNGNLTFTNATESMAAENMGCTLAVAATDYDRDGDSDIMIANDFGEWVVPNQLLNNLSGSGYENISEESDADVMLYGMGIAVGDYDEDQDFDYYITNLGSNVLLQQQEGSFNDVTVAAGVEDKFYSEDLLVGWGTFFFDYNNNTLLDLFVSNGHIDAVSWLDNYDYQPNRLYENMGDGSFVDATDQVFPGNYKTSRGCAFGDYNKDGKLDVGVVNVHNFFEDNGDIFTLYLNGAEDQNYAQFKLVGMACNKDAIGAHMELHADSRIFIREVDGGSSHGSQNTSVLHFGLGEIENMDSAVVYWPGGQPQTIYDLYVNEYVQIIQDTTTVIEEPGDTTEYENELPKLDSTPTDTLTIGVNSWNESFGLQIYPNPIHNSFNLEYFLLYHDQISVRWLDLRGREVWMVCNLPQQPGFHRMSLNVPKHIHRGTYLCEVVTKRGKVTQKVQLSRE